MVSLDLFCLVGFRDHDIVPSDFHHNELEDVEAGAVAAEDGGWKRWAQEGDASET